MGLRNIEEKLKREKVLKRKGTALAIKELETMIQSIKDLHIQLDKLEKKFKGKLKSNPEISKKIMGIREELGLPRELGVFEIKAKPGLVDKLLTGNFYEQLAMHILEIGRNSISKTGGIMSFPELIDRLREYYGGKVVGITDTNKALQVLLNNKLISGIEELESGFKIIIFISQELSPDTNEIFRLANRNNGEISVEEIILKTNWSLERVNRALAYLESKNIVVRNEDMDGIKFYFPGI